MVKKKNLFEYKGIPLYFYMLRAYTKFVSTGKGMDFPFTVQIQTQSYCNARCTICPYPFIKNKLTHGTMTWDLYSKIANEIASSPFFTEVLYFLQDEPLIDKRIFDWVKYLKSKNPNKKAVIVTNGELLDQFSSTEITQSNLDYLVISLNANSKDVFEKINKGLDYERVMRNIDSLLSNNDIKQKVVLSFVFTKQNEHEVYQAIRYWNERGVATSVFELTNRGGVLSHYDDIRPTAKYNSKGSLSKIWRALKAPLHRTLGCHMPFYQMNILFDGKVIICCHDWTGTTEVGNAKTSTLREIWNSKKMNGIRQLILRKRYEQINPCQKCSFGYKAMIFRKLQKGQR